jgi:hypothetical protein
VTSLGTLTTLTVDNVITDGTTIGHTDDTDLMTLADGSVTFTGSTVIGTADVNGGAIDGAAIGANSASTGAFTTVSASGATDLNSTLNTSGTVSLDGSANELRFYEGSNYVGFEAPALSADQVWALPTADGSANQVLKTDGTWGAYDVTSSGGVLSLTPNSIDFDSWGRVWIGSFEDNNNVGGASNGGVAMLDYSGDPADPDETEWTKVNVNTDASTNTIWSLGVNSSDVLYLLSPKGLNGLTLKFSNSDPVSHYGFTYYPNISFSSGSKLRIDPRDNIWTTSPTQGVYVLTSSASYWPDINGLTAENSYLLSNNVAAVAFDENEGLAYIATDRGINVVKIPYAKKNSAYSNVDIFPSPFRIPTATPLTIDGLMDGSSCKIMTLTGRVLQTIESRPDVEGYQAFWDGRDESGHWVGTGVYLIAMYDEKGASSFSKIAVIRN